MKNLRWLPVLMCVFGLMVVACDSGDDGDEGSEAAAETGAETGTEAAQVVASDDGFAFSPAELTIAAGETVTFVLGSIHNMVEVDEEAWNADDGTAPLEGGISADFGETKTITFDTAGTYYYVCVPHAGGGMKGKITVE